MECESTDHVTLTEKEDAQVSPPKNEDETEEKVSENNTNIDVEQVAMNNCLNDGEENAVSSSGSVEKCETMENDQPVDGYLAMSENILSGEEKCNSLSNEDLRNDDWNDFAPSLTENTPHAISTNNDICEQNHADANSTLDESFQSHGLKGYDESHESDELYCSAVEDVEENKGDKERSKYQELERCLSNLSQKQSFLKTQIPDLETSVAKIEKEKDSLLEIIDENKITFVNTLEKYVEKLKEAVVSDSDTRIGNKKKLLNDYQSSVEEYQNIQDELQKIENSTEQEGIDEFTTKVNELSQKFSGLERPEQTESWEIREFIPIDLNESEIDRLCERVVGSYKDITRQENENRDSYKKGELERILVKDIYKHERFQTIKDFLSDKGVTVLSPIKIDKNTYKRNSDCVDMYCFARRPILPALPVLCNVNGQEVRIYHDSQQGCSMCKLYGHSPYTEKCPAYMANGNPNVEAFQGHHHPFSNFYPCSLYVFGTEFSSSEQAYQWMKAKELGYNDIAEQIMQSNHGSEAKRLARGISVENMDTWEGDRDKAMREILEAKLHGCAFFKNKLLQSGNKILAEATDNKYWATGLFPEKTVTTDPKYWPGKNVLGKLLTELRSKVRDSNPDHSDYPDYDSKWTRVYNYPRDSNLRNQGEQAIDWFEQSGDGSYQVETDSKELYQNLNGSQEFITETQLKGRQDDYPTTSHPSSYGGPGSFVYPHPYHPFFPPYDQYYQRFPTAPPPNPRHITPLINHQSTAPPPNQRHVTPPSNHQSTPPPPPNQQYITPPTIHKPPVMGPSGPVPWHHAPPFYYNQPPPTTFKPPFPPEFIPRYHPYGSTQFFASQGNKEDAYKDASDEGNQAVDLKKPSDDEKPTQEVHGDTEKFSDSEVSISGNIPSDENANDAVVPDAKEEFHSKDIVAESTPNRTDVKAYENKPETRTDRYGDRNSNQRDQFHARGSRGRPIIPRLQKQAMQQEHRYDHQSSTEGYSKSRYGGDQRNAYRGHRGGMQGHMSDPQRNYTNNRHYYNDYSSYKNDRPRYGDRRPYNKGDYRSETSPQSNSQARRSPEQSRHSKDNRESNRIEDKSFRSKTSGREPTISKKDASKYTKEKTVDKPGKSLTEVEFVKAVDELMKKTNANITEWYDSHSVGDNHRHNRLFISTVMASVCSAAVSEGKDELNMRPIMSRKELFTKCLKNKGLESQALWSVQNWWEKSKYKPDVLRQFFDALYDEEIISIDAFYTWECQSPKSLLECPDIKEFFKWMRSDKY